MLYLFYLLNFFNLNINNDWVYIFNGKNLDGWEIKIRNHKLGDNYKKTIKVEWFNQLRQLLPSQMA